MTFAARAATAQTPEDIRDLIAEFYEMPGNGVGGSLHIVLDDGNHRREDVEFCLNYAIEEKDEDGEALCRALLRLPDDVYRIALSPALAPPPCGGCEALPCRCARNALVARWGFARELYRAAVLALLPENVVVVGPNGRSKVVPRDVAERMAADGRLQPAASLDAARAALGLPPAFCLTEGD